MQRLPSGQTVFCSPWTREEALVLAEVLIRFGKRMREVRERVGISQEKLAEKAGLHRTYVSSVERGKRNISLLNIERLARALSVTLAELMPEIEQDS